MSSHDSRLCNCLWRLLLGSGNMRSTQITLAVIRLRNDQSINQSIRNIAKTLGIPKSTVWFIINNKKTTGELNYVKRPGKLRKTNVVNDQRTHSMGRKPPWQQPNRSRTLSWMQEMMCQCLPYIKLKTNQQDYRGRTTRCKPLMSQKNRKSRLWFAKKHLKEPQEFWNKVLWTDETKFNMQQSDGKGKGMEKKRKCPWSKAYHLMRETWWTGCYGLGLYSCLCGLTCLHRWCDYWQNYWTALHHATR